MVLHVYADFIPFSMPLVPLGINIDIFHVTKVVADFIPETDEMCSAHCYTGYSEIRIIKEVYIYYEHIEYENRRSGENING